MLRSISLAGRGTHVTPKQCPAAAAAATAHRRNGIPAVAAGSCDAACVLCAGGVTGEAPGGRGALGRPEAAVERLRSQRCCRCRSDRAQGSNNNSEGGCSVLSAVPSSSDDVARLAALIRLCTNAADSFRGAIRQCIALAAAKGGRAMPRSESGPPSGGGHTTSLGGVGLSPSSTGATVSSPPLSMTSSSVSGGSPGLNLTGGLFGDFPSQSAWSSNQQPATSGGGHAWMVGPSADNRRAASRLAVAVAPSATAGCGVAVGDRVCSAAGSWGVVTAVTPNGAAAAVAWDDGIPRPWAPPPAVNPTVALWPRFFPGEGQHDRLTRVGDACATLAPPEGDPMQSLLAVVAASEGALEGDGPLNGDSQLGVGAPHRLLLLKAAVWAQLLSSLYTGFAARARRLLSVAATLAASDTWLASQRGVKTLQPVAEIDVAEGAEALRAAWRADVARLAAWWDARSSFRAAVRKRIAVWSDMSLRPTADYEAALHALLTESNIIDEQACHDARDCSFC